MGEVEIWRGRVSTASETSSRCTKKPSVSAKIVYSIRDCRAATVPTNSKLPWCSKNADTYHRGNILIPGGKTLSIRATRRLARTTPPRRPGHTCPPSWHSSTSAGARHSPPTVHVCPLGQHPTKTRRVPGGLPDGSLVSLGGSFARRIVSTRNRRIVRWLARLLVRRLVRVARGFVDACPTARPHHSAVRFGASDHSCRSLDRLGVGSLDGGSSGEIR
jgi:hypothetical protein